MIKPTYVFASAVAVAALTACSSPESDPQSSSSPLTTTIAPPSSSANTDVVSGQETQQLCDQIKRALPDWRIQTPSLTHPAFNILVQVWGIEHGVTAQIVNDRSIVDDLTQRQCPDVRNEALQALAVPNLAAGLVGLG